MNLYVLRTQEKNTHKSEGKEEKYEEEINGFIVGIVVILYSIFVFPLP